MAMRRTTMYSSGGRKLYAVRNADGSFKDIQTYQRAHRDDIAHKSAAELAAGARKAGKVVKKAARKAVKAVKKAAKKVARKAPARKRAAKKAARRT